MPYWLRRIAALFWAPMTGPWCVHGRWMREACGKCAAQGAALGIAQEQDKEQS